MSDAIGKALALLEALDGPTVSAIRAALSDVVELRRRTRQAFRAAREAGLISHDSDGPAEDLLAIRGALEIAGRRIRELEAELARRSRPE